MGQHPANPSPLFLPKKRKVKSHFPIFACRMFGRSLHSHHLYHFHKQKHRLQGIPVLYRTSVPGSGRQSSTAGVFRQPAIELENNSNINYDESGCVTVNNESPQAPESAETEEQKFNQVIVPKGKRTHLSCQTVRRFM